MTVQIRVKWSGHRAAFGPRLFGGGQRFKLATAEAIAAELRGRGHAATVERRWAGSLSTDAAVGQLGLFGGVKTDNGEDNE